MPIADCGVQSFSLEHRAERLTGRFLWFLDLIAQVTYGLPCLLHESVLSRSIDFTETGPLFQDWGTL